MRDQDIRIEKDVFLRKSGSPLKTTVPRKHVNILEEVYSFVVVFLVLITRGEIDKKVHIEMYCVKYNCFLLFSILK